MPRRNSSSFPGSGAPPYSESINGDDPFEISNRSIAASQPGTVPTLPSYSEASRYAPMFQPSEQDQRRRQNMHSMITAIFVEALQGPQHALRFSLLKKWKEELFAVIEPKEHSWWCYEAGDDGMYTRYYQTGSKLREIGSTAKGQKMIISVTEGLLGMPTGALKIDHNCTVDWLIDQAGLGSNARERLAQFRHEPLEHPRKFRINPHVVSNRNHLSSSQPRASSSSPLPTANNPTVQSHSRNRSSSPPPPNWQQVQDEEARKRQLEVHAYVDELCNDVLQHSEGNRRGDAQLLASWKGELFATIEPEEKRLMIYLPDGAGYLRHYRDLCDWLKRIEGKAAEMIVPVYSWGRRTDQRQIAPAYTVEKLIERLNLGRGGWHRLERYHREQTVLQEPSIGSNERRRICGRMAQISQTPILGRASEANGGLLF